MGNDNFISEKRTLIYMYRNWTFFSISSCLSISLWSSIIFHIGENFLDTVPKLYQRLWASFTIYIQLAMFNLWNSIIKEERSNQFQQNRIPRRTPWWMYWNSTINLYSSWWRSIFSIYKSAGFPPHKTKVFIWYFIPDILLYQTKTTGAER